MSSGLLVNARLSVINFVRETSIVAKCGCFILCLFYLLSFVFNPLRPLGIVPGNLIPPNFWIWTIFTHQFIEVNFVSLLFSCIILIQSSQILEPQWTLVGYLTFFGIVTVLSGLCSGICYLFYYMLTFNISYLFDVGIYGMCGYTSGFFVALKQARGDKMLVGSIGLYVTHLSLLYITIVLALRIVGLLPGSYLVHITCGTMVSWIYLRFYQSHSRGRGDSAEKFAFKTFFPAPIQGPVGMLADMMFQFLLKVKICRKTSYRYDVGAPSKITITLSGVHALDAERRRNKAIKALDERLQKAEEANDEAGEWPDLDDEQTPLKSDVQARLVEDVVSTSSGSSPSDIVHIDVETSSPSDENSAP